jgi:hypothetical protein
MKLNATFGDWNDKFVGVSASGREFELVETIRAIGSARGDINVGIVVNGHQDSASFDSVGSTQAMNQVIKGCKLDDVKKGDP